MINRCRLWKAQRPNVHLPGRPGASADCQRSDVALGAIRLAPRTLPDDLSVLSGLSVVDQLSARTQIKQKADLVYFAVFKSAACCL